jgi:hypothetical protein
VNCIYVLISPARYRINGPRDSSSPILRPTQDSGAMAFTAAPWPELSNPRFSCLNSDPKVVADSGNGRVSLREILTEIRRAPRPSHGARWNPATDDEFWATQRLISPNRSRALHQQPHEAPRYVLSPSSSKRRRGRRWRMHSDHGSLSLSRTTVGV